MIRSYMTASTARRFHWVFYSVFSFWQSDFSSFQLFACFVVDQILDNDDDDDNELLSFGLTEIDAFDSNDPVVDVVDNVALSRYVASIVISLVFSTSVVIGVGTILVIDCVVVFDVRRDNKFD